MKNQQLVSRYYITTKVRSDDRHAIHKENCPFIANDKNLLFLGHFMSSDDAVAEGHKHYDHSKCCRFCIPEKEEKFAETHMNTTVSKQMLPDNNQLLSSSNGSVYYILN